MGSQAQVGTGETVPGTESIPWYKQRKMQAAIVLCIPFGTFIGAAYLVYKAGNVFVEEGVEGLTRPISQKIAQRRQARKRELESQKLEEQVNHRMSVLYLR